MKCQKCRFINDSSATECSNCGVLFKDLRRAEPERPSGPVLCSWSDHGQRCVCRGIISSGTTGGGQWYCREHWERINSRQPDVVGNALPANRGESMAAKKWHEAMAAYKASGGTSLLDRKGNMAMPVKREREPGDDDDYADLVPEQQA